MLNKLHRQAIVLAVLLAASVALAACGGGSGGDGSGSTESGGTTPTQGDTGSIGRSEFIRQADAACTKGQKTVEAEVKAYLKKSNVKEIGEADETQQEEVIETIAIPSLRTQIDEIRGLGAPSGEEAQVEGFLAAAEEGIEKGEDDPQAMFTSSTKVFAKADELADFIGFKVCGQR
jgi:hypothetical protein